MKKIICLALVAMFVLAGCGQMQKSNNDNTNGNKISVNEDASNDKILDKVDEKFVETYIEGLDVALIDENELLFTDSKEISENTLYMLFCFEIGIENVDTQQWYNSETGKYHITAADIKKYDEKIIHGEIVIDDSYAVDTEILSGFGGMRTANIIDKSVLDDGNVSVTAEFTNDDASQVYYTKTYIFNLADGVKYVSVVKD